MFYRLISHGGSVDEEAVAGDAHLSAQMFGSKVDHLHNISIFEEQSALKAATPLSF